MLYVNVSGSPMRMVCLNWSNKFHSVLTKAHAYVVTMMCMRSLCTSMYLVMVVKQAGKEVVKLGSWEQEA